MIFLMGWFWSSVAQELNDVQEKRIQFSTIPNTQQKSLQSYYRALKTANYGTERFSVLLQLAAHHIDQANSDSIIHYGNLYLREIRNWDQDKKAKSSHFTKAYFILGIGSRFNGLLDNAVKWHIQGITEAEASAQDEFGYRNKIGLANTYNLKSEPEKTHAILKDLPQPLQEDWPELLPKALTFLGDAHYLQTQYSEANEVYNEALKKSIEIEDYRQELTVKLKLGTIAELNNEYSLAFELYNNARETGMQKGYLNIYFEGTIRMGELFYKEENYEAANAALSVAYINAIERDNLHYQKEILNIQRRVFAVTGDHSNAYAVMTQLSGINTEIARRQQQKVIRELEVQYETLEKEKAISSLEEDKILKEAELKRQKTIRNAFLIGFLIILIPILGLLYLYYQKIQTQSELAQKQKVINEQKVTTLKQGQELNLIKASIKGQDEERKRIAQELHDSIGGNLAGIKLQVSSIGENSSQWKAINAQLDDTYQLVRNISHTLIPKKFTQNAFTDLVKDYVSAISINGKLKVNLHTQPEERLNIIDENVQFEIYKIIQELVTNTLKHALASEIAINLNAVENELSLLFEDNGKGFDPSKTKDGLGFQNLKSRVKHLKGALHIDSTENRGTVISITIPLE